MENYVIELLRASGADAWTVADEHRTGWEFYFIRHRLDQNRARDTEHITLTLYKRFTECSSWEAPRRSLRPPPAAARRRR